MIINKPPKGWDYSAPTNSPADMLKYEFLPFLINKEVPASVQSIAEGARVTEELADKLSVFTGTSAQFWLNVQRTYDESGGK